jgi:hypothetical protein
MSRARGGLAICIIGVFFASLGWAQSQETAIGTPTATKWVLDAAGPTQHNLIKSVFLMVCPATQKKGTSFLLTIGVVVTNAHVVRGCTESNLYAVTPLGKRLTFSRLVTDPERDLAVLHPNEKVEGGLELGADSEPSLGHTVSTWGFPLIYNGPAPILSVGYVAGFNAISFPDRIVKHIIVNGAFNPGNSGGPVFESQDNKVVGIVVWKQVLFSKNVPTIIEGFRHPGVKTEGTFSIAQPDGTFKSVTDQEAIADVLEEFYDTVQVVIGEAISVAELKQFLKEQEKNLN